MCSFLESKKLLKKWSNLRSTLTQNMVHFCGPDGRTDGQTFAQKTLLFDRGLPKFVSKTVHFCAIWSSSGISPRDQLLPSITTCICEFSEPDWVRLVHPITLTATTRQSDYILKWWGIALKINVYIIKQWNKSTFRI